MRLLAAALLLACNGTAPPSIDASSTTVFDAGLADGEARGMDAEACIGIGRSCGLGVPCCPGATCSPAIPDQEASALPPPMPVCR